MEQRNDLREHTMQVAPVVALVIALTAARATMQGEGNSDFEEPYWFEMFDLDKDPWLVVQRCIP